MLFTHIPSHCESTPSIISMYQYDKYTKNSHTHKVFFCGYTQQPELWVIQLWIRIHRLCLCDSSNLKPIDLWHSWHIALVLWMKILFIHKWLCPASMNYHSYLSMIAHMSRLTFSNAPTVPFSTACISAGWSSTKIACMQPWKDRWEGGKSVWRKYPETSQRKNKDTDKKLEGEIWEKKPRNKRIKMYGTCTRVIIN